MNPIHVLMKPASGNCNMRCKYCFYEEEVVSRAVPDCGIMEEQVLEKVIKQVLESASGECSFTFQGGEPTLAGPGFYEKTVFYCGLYNINKCRIHYAIQTNGYILDATWFDLFAKHQFLVGISLDGYEEIHDRYRRDAAGEGTFKKVMSSIEQLKKYNIPYNILTVIHNETAVNVNKVYNFFRQNSFCYQQYVECLDPMGQVPGQQEYSLTPENYLCFLKGIFKKWYRDMIAGNYVYNRYFENLLLIMSGRNPESCNMVGQCSKQIVVEADGSVYPCDFYARDEWKLGNFVYDNMPMIEKKRKELRFIQQSKSVPNECGECKWYWLCKNGCRRNCEPVADWKRGKNYYCNAYRGFFEFAYDGLVEILHRYLCSERDDI